MKKIILLLVLTFTFFSCNSPSNPSGNEDELPKTLNKENARYVDYNVLYDEHGTLNMYIGETIKIKKYPELYISTYISKEPEDTNDSFYFEVIELQEDENFYYVFAKEESFIHCIYTEKSFLDEPKYQDYVKSIENDPKRSIHNVNFFHIIIRDEETSKKIKDKVEYIKTNREKSTVIDCYNISSNIEFDLEEFNSENKSNEFYLSYLYSIVYQNQEYKQNWDVSKEKIIYLVLPVDFKPINKYVIEKKYELQYDEEMDCFYIDFSDIKDILYSFYPIYSFIKYPFTNYDYSIELNIIK